MPSTGAVLVITLIVIVVSVVRPWLSSTSSVTILLPSNEEHSAAISAVIVPLVLVTLLKVTTAGGNAETVKFPVAVSKSLTVAMMLLLALPPCVRVKVAAAVILGGVLAQVFSSNVMLLALELTTAISRRLSLFRSPSASETGPVPVPNVLAAPNVPSPLPRSSEMKLLPLLVTARSALASPS